MGADEGRSPLPYSERSTVLPVSSREGETDGPWTVGEDTWALGAKTLALFCPTHSTPPAAGL